MNRKREVMVETNGNPKLFFKLIRSKLLGKGQFDRRKDSKGRVSGTEEYTMQGA